MQLLLLVKLPITHKRVEEQFALGIGGEILFTGNAHTVEPSTEHQVFNAFLVARRQADTLHEIEHRSIRPVLLPLVDNVFSSGRAHALDSGKTETDGSSLVHAELLSTLVDIGSQRGNAHHLALVHEFGDFHNVRKVSAHIGRHVFGGIMCLEISRLVGHP